jgi:integrase
MTRQRPTRYPGVFEDEKTGEYGYVFWFRDPKTGARKQRKRRGVARRAIDARDKRDEERRAISKGTFAPSRLTVAELFERDLELQLENGWLRATTAEQYRRQFGLHAAPAFGHVRAQDLRADHLDRLFGDMRKKGLASSTVRQTANMLSGVFKRAVKRGDLAENPCKRATPPASEVEETASWSLAELRTFLAHDDVRSDPDYALWQLLAATGLRRGEALALTRDDVDLDAAAVHVRRNAIIVDGHVVIGEPKTRRSRRRVKIGPDTVQALRDHLAAQRKHRLVMGTGWHEHGLVFPAVDGRPFNPSTVSRRFCRLVATTGLPPVSLHALRHGHATLLLDQGERIHDVAARLGHDPTVLLRTYAHHGSESQDSAAALESLLGGSRPTLRAVPDDATPAGDEAEPSAEGSAR